jgi:hypothetical protein
MPPMLARYLSVLLPRSFSASLCFDFPLLSRKIGDWPTVAAHLAPSAFSSFGSLTQQMWFTGFSWLVVRFPK